MERSGTRIKDINLFVQKYGELFELSQDRKLSKKKSAEIRIQLSTMENEFYEFVIEKHLNQLASSLRTFTIYSQAKPFDFTSGSVRESYIKDLLTGRLYEGIGEPDGFKPKPRKGEKWKNIIVKYYESPIRNFIAYMYSVVKNAVYYLIRRNEYGDWMDEEFKRGNTVKVEPDELSGPNELEQEFPSLFGDEHREHYPFIFMSQQLLVRHEMIPAKLRDDQTETGRILLFRTFSSKEF